VIVSVDTGSDVTGSGIVGSDVADGVGVAQAENNNSMIIQ
jgi:hypothetical protein